MILKKKSLIVALVSGFVLSCVLILTLIGYIAYIELKNEESKRSYQYSLGRLNARVYEKYLEVSALTAKTEDAGALRGKNIVGGVIKNRGDKDIYELRIKIKFIDRDGAVIYETILDPQEPALGSGFTPKAPISNMPTRANIPIRRGEVAPFKRIIFGCPGEISSSISSFSGFSKYRGRWSGKLGCELVSVKLCDPGI